MKKSFLKGAVFGYIVGAITMVSLIVFAAPIVRQMTATYKNIKVTVNGSPVTLRDGGGKVIEPFISDGTTYLPVRAIATVFNKNIVWDGATNTVKISDRDVAIIPVIKDIVMDDYIGEYKVNIEGYDREFLIRKNKYGYLLDIDCSHAHIRYGLAYYDENNKCFTVKSYDTEWVGGNDGYPADIEDEIKIIPENGGIKVKWSKNTGGSVKNSEAYAVKTGGITRNFVNSGYYIFDNGDPAPYELD